MLHFYYARTFAALEAKKMIYAAIEHWENETCIRFEEVDMDVNVTEQHILFTSEYG